MPGTYSQIYIQIIFAVKGREGLVAQNWEERLYKYVTGIVQKKEQKMLAINGMPIIFIFSLVCALPAVFLI